ncbi:hypothetical protein ABK040_014217 [Willaertia magna]
MAASSDNLIATALLSLKELSKDHENPNNTSIMTLEPQFQISSHDYEHQQLKVLMQNTFKCGITKSPFSPTSNNNSIKVFTPPSPSPVRTTTTYNITNIKNTPPPPSWSFTTSYSSPEQKSSISKPRKMMLNRWYAEKTTYPHQIIIQQQVVSPQDIINVRTQGTSPSTPRSAISTDSMISDKTFDKMSTESCNVEVQTQFDNIPSVVRRVSNASTDDKSEEGCVSNEEQQIVSKKKQRKSKKDQSGKSGQHRSGWWTEVEHEAFLKGLKHCGHNWKLISQSYVKTRGRRQCASHAQKWYQSARYLEDKEKMKYL